MSESTSAEFQTASVEEEDFLARPSFWRRFRRQVIPMLALIYLVVMILAAIFAPWVAPKDPLEQNLLEICLGPSRENILGTDNFGRDVLSRIIFGSRITVQAGLQAVGLAILLGVPLGLISGYAGRRTDQIVMWTNDIFFILPPVLIALTVLAVFGPSLTYGMAAVGFGMATRYIRLTRGVVLAEKERTYVESAKVTGIQTPIILFRHILPNIFSPLVVQTSLLFGVVILVEASLSFVGVGAPVGQPSWGRMLSDARLYVGQQPFMVIPPGLAITLTVLAFNLLGDGLRDVMGRKVTATDVSIRKRKKERTDVAELPAKTIERSGRPSSDSILSIRELEVQFPSISGEFTVLHNIGLDVRKGETLGLIGESGSGKSMTAWAIMDLVPFPGKITEGSIRLGGQDLLGLSGKQIQSIRGKKIAMIFQDPLSALDPVRTVGQQICEPLIFHESMTKQEARVRAIELLNMVRVPEPRQRLDEYPHQFSGGMAQRAVIARALACNPTILIADEPTTALDVSIQGQVLDLMRGLQEELGMAMLFITHNLGVAADICHRGAVMYAGQIVEMAPIDDLVENPKHPYTAALLMAMPENEQRTDRLANIKGQVPLPWAWPKGCRFHPRCEYAIDQCTRGDIDLLDVGPSHAVRCLRSSK